ncbi:hypothetical protein ACF09C_00885 [Streptomyces sp. NPDC014870]|uniref:hypothetical protein n=1 Tax=Streptomyces sp. NPDC014870 TaxID=3364925 RepID=UPI0036FAB2F9
MRAKAKLSEYVRLHKVLTGVTERDIWRSHGIQRFAGTAVKRLAQGLGLSVAELGGVTSAGGRPLDALLEQVPDEFDAWVRGVVARLEDEAAARERALDEAYKCVAPLADDRGAFARAVKTLPVDPQVRSALFLRLDGRPTDLYVWRSIRPEAADPYTTDPEN